MKFRKFKKGFTLVEIIVSVAILVMVMIPIGNAIIQSGKDNANSTKTIIATQLVQKNMEDIKSRINASTRKGLAPYTPSGGKIYDNSSPKNLVDNEGNIINVDGSLKKFPAEDLTANAPGTSTGTTPWHDGDTKYTTATAYTAALAVGNDATWSDYYKQDSYEYIVKYTVSKKFGASELQKTDDYTNGSLGAFGDKNNPLLIDGENDVVLKKDGTNFKIDGVSGIVPITAAEAILYIKAKNPTGDKAIFVNSGAADGITLHCNVIDSQGLSLDGETGIRSKGGKNIVIDRNDINSGYYDALSGAQNSVAVFNIRIEVYDKHNPTKLLASANSKSMIKN